MHVVRHSYAIIGWVHACTCAHTATVLGTPADNPKLNVRNGKYVVRKKRHTGICHGVLTGTVPIEVRNNQGMVKWLGTARVSNKRR